MFHTSDLLQTLVGIKLYRLDHLRKMQDVKVGAIPESNVLPLGSELLQVLGLCQSEEDERAITRHLENKVEGRP